MDFIWVFPLSFCLSKNVHSSFHYSECRTGRIGYRHRFDYYQRIMWVFTDRGHMSSINRSHNYCWRWAHVKRIPWFSRTEDYQVPIGRLNKSFRFLLLGELPEGCHFIIGIYFLSMKERWFLFPMCLFAIGVIGHHQRSRFAVTTGRNDGHGFRIWASHLIMMNDRSQVDTGRMGVQKRGWQLWRRRCRLQ